MRSSSVDQIILDILNEEHTHLTSLEVFTEARKRLPAVNQSTIYRSLERMADNGIVSISDMGTGSMVYELVNTDKHHHLVCQSCGKIFTIEHDQVAQFFASVENKNDFKLLTNHLVLFGICTNCRNAEIE